MAGYFPWCSFYGGSQRAFLMKEELVSGAHGIEGRYPFLDAKVVQEFLWLSPHVKNGEYKKPVADFLRSHAFPAAWRQKLGFTAATNVEVETLPKSVRRSQDLNIQVEGSDKANATSKRRPGIRPALTAPIRRRVRSIAAST